MEQQVEHMKRFKEIYSNYDENYKKALKAILMIKHPFDISNDKFTSYMMDIEEFHTSCRDVMYRRHYDISRGNL